MYLYTEQKYYCTVVEMKLQVLSGNVRLNLFHMRHEGVNQRWRSPGGLASVCVLRANKACKVKYVPAGYEWCSCMIIAFCCNQGQQKLLLLILLPGKGEERCNSIRGKTSFFSFFNFSSVELLYFISRKLCNCFGTGLTYILSSRTIFSWCMK